MRTEHEHHWITDSAHTTSEGLVAYQHCACGGRRVTLSPAVTVAATPTDRR
ncbi:hypothetical protein PWG71_22725 [Nocardiopsis sp. N85]|uniref:hypothetical protein n=1 Tax=Nocardiopsis sp. N85 TaxID=3029400 RepID=UPI00237FA0CD|nr:hypothetical protein [Nocardiopsis sp. N85]MDE3724214.1 hypothetical protein [Nocardiopsis sp. N85]